MLLQKRATLQNTSPYYLTYIGANKMPYFMSPDFLNRTLLFIVVLCLVFHNILNKGKTSYQIILEFT